MLDVSVEHRRAGPVMDEQTSFRSVTPPTPRYSYLSSLEPSSCESDRFFYSGVAALDVRPRRASRSQHWRPFRCNNGHRDAQLPGGTPGAVAHEQVLRGKRSPAMTKSKMHFLYPGGRVLTSCSPRRQAARRSGQTVHLGCPGIESGPSPARVTKPEALAKNQSRATWINSSKYARPTGTAKQIVAPGTWNVLYKLALEGLSNGSRSGPGTRRFSDYWGRCQGWSRPDWGGDGARVPGVQKPKLHGRRRRSGTGMSRRRAEPPAVPHRCSACICSSWTRTPVPAPAGRPANPVVPGKPSDPLGRDLPGRSITGDEVMCGTGRIPVSASHRRYTRPHNRALQRAARRRRPDFVRCVRRRPRRCAELLTEVLL